MSRQEKKTRMRMLPPRVQLQQRDALTGSYPTTVRFSTDGRTGKYPISFDDTETINFNTYYSSSLYDLTSLKVDVIHYQRWNEQEFIDNDGTNIFFKQTYVGTPYNGTEDTNIKNINDTGTIGTNNWFKGPSLDSNSNSTWPGNTTPHPKLSSIYIADTDLNRIDNTYDYTDVDPNRDFTIAMWINPESFTLDTPLVRLSQTNNSLAGSQSWYFALFFGQLCLVLIDETGTYDSGPYALAYSDDIADSIGNYQNKWVHVAATYSGGGSAGIKLYINGLPVTNSTSDLGVYIKMSSSSTRLIYGSSGGAGNNLYYGYMSEFAYIGKTLTDQEINDLYNLNLIGKAIYDKVDIGYSPAIGLPNTNNWLQQPDASDVEEIIYSTIVAPTGSVISSVIDNLPFIHFTPGQEITPFRDSDQPAVDGKSSGDSFYATGSAVADVGEGFTSPLWSKNKIEIDISTDTSASLYTYARKADITKNLAYYNFITKKWELLAGDHGPYLFNQFGTARMAFSPSLMTWTNGLDPGNKGLATTTFGFPFHSLYAATSSQLLSMKNYINEPFLLEKVVIDFTGSFQSGFSQVFQPGTLFSGEDPPLPYDPTAPIEFSSSYAVNNFFILNQRLYNASTRLFSGWSANNTPYYINFSLPNGTINTVRDLIGYGSIASFNNAFGWAYTASNNPDALYGGRWKRDLNIINTISSDATKSLWSGHYEMSFSIKSPNRFGDTPNEINPSISTPKALGWQVFNLGNTPAGVGHLQNGGTLGLSSITPSGRNTVSPLAQLNVISSSAPINSLVKVPYINFKEYNKINPYLLFPTDNLIIGWAAATMDDYTFIGNVAASSTNLTASMLTIAAGPAKITLYGSYIREGREYNDGTNQLLSSDSVHEVIE